MENIRFNQLSLNEKALVVTEFGNYLETITFRGYYLHLYNLGSYFIEVKFNDIKGEIEKITLLQYNELDLYISHISMFQLKGYRWK